MSNNVPIQTISNPKIRLQALLKKFYHTEPSYLYEIIFKEYILSGNYLGCYIDNQYFRDLNGSVVNLNSLHISNMICIEICNGMSFKYAATQKR